MKVVLFCGGLGLRIRDLSDNVPKPMIQIGQRPILWHVMKYYAHYGHKDFILALGYKAEVIKRYFLEYEEGLSNNFVLERGGRQKTLMNTDIEDWRITFVDTGVNTPIGERLLRVRQYLDDDQVFMANYTDSLTDCPIPSLLEHAERNAKMASFLCVKPTLSYHVVSMSDDAVVARIQHIRDSPIRINGGYFVLRREIFDYIEEGQELVNEPFQRLIEMRELIAHSYDGFWASMDTLKDRQELEAMDSRGDAPWEVWKKVNRALVGKGHAAANT
jgi:glucose-1-phosphate cytidylyltransferase